MQHHHVEQAADEGGQQHAAGAEDDGEQQGQGGDHDRADQVPVLGVRLNSVLRPNAGADDRRRHWRPQDSTISAGTLAAVTR